MKTFFASIALDDLVNREWKTKLSANVAGGKVAFRGRCRLAWQDAAGRLREKFVEL